MPKDLEDPAAARPSAQVLHLKNKTCIYCGTSQVADSTTWEHVIGRRFVPKGTLNGRWNLIAQCCSPCNGKKADLENDISAILLQANGFGEWPIDDPQLTQEAIRKGKSKHRSTGQSVKDSRSKLSVPIEMDARSRLTFGLVGPPQLDSARAAQLAWYHVTAFTYLTTFDTKTSKGRFPSGAFSIFNQPFNRIGAT